MDASAAGRPIRLILVVLAAVAAALAIPLAGAASAGVTPPCDGSVVIDGNTYGPRNDTPANPIVIPAKQGLIAEWDGNTGGAVIKNHSGSVGIVIGPGALPIASWSGENAEETTSAADRYPIDQARDLLPFEIVGLWEVVGEHSGEGGACSGSAMVLIEGSPLTTPVGAAAAAGTVVAGAGLAVAATGRKP